MKSADVQDAARSANSESAGIWPDLSLLGVAVIWGVNIPIMKNGLDRLDPFVLNAVRLLVSAVVLTSLTMLQRRERRSRPEDAAHGKISPRSLMIYALIVSALYQLLFLLGIARTTSGNTALILATVPMWTALLARIFLAEKLVLLGWCGLLIALTGTVLVACQNQSISGKNEHLPGNLFVLGAAISWAAGTVYSRPLLKTISPMELSARSAVLAFPMHLVFMMLGSFEQVGELRTFSMWGIILYSGILSTGLALPMWSYGVRHAGAAHAAIIQNLVPLVAIVAAWMTRGESASAAQLIGGTLILTGLVIMRRSRTQPSRSA
ncbi:MAG: EamA family transporter [Planctomycetaceae bacterium]